MLTTKKFYHIDEWNDKLYHSLFKEYNFHVYLVMDLVLELTRAANYICDKVRENILSSFRIKEGKLLVTYGPSWDLSYTTVNVEYDNDERVNLPYPGLEKFKEICEKRDFHFSAGKSVDDPSFLSVYNKMR